MIYAASIILLSHAPAVGDERVWPAFEKVKHLKFQFSFFLALAYESKFNDILKTDTGNYLDARVYTWIHRSG